MDDGYKELCSTCTQMHMHIDPDSPRFDLAFTVITTPLRHSPELGAPDFIALKRQ